MPSVVVIAYSLFLFVPAYSRVISESYATTNDVVDDPAKYLALVHDPNEQEVLIHHVSESVLKVTKDLLSLTPRSSGDVGVSARLSRMQELHPRDAEKVLESHGVAVPTLRLPTNCDYALYYRTMDGACNNLQHPCWGKTDEPYQRWLPPVYGNGLDSPRVRADNGLLPSPRQVYQWVSSQWQQTINSTLPHLTGFLTMWGQMVTHDVLLTPGPTINGSTLRCCNENLDHPDCMPIRMNFADGFYKFGHCMEFARSAANVFSSCRPISIGNQREQMNQLTSFLDASLVYGTSEQEVHSLRDKDGQGAKLLVDSWHCPRRRSGKCKSTHSFCDERCFHTGEKRANENPVLASLHAVWVREHNRIADELSTKGWPADTVFHVTRKIVGAILQHITYNEYLPAILGQHLANLMNLTSRFPANHIYDPNVNPTIYNVFATAAFRYGHSMVDSRFMRKHLGYSASPLLSEDFFSVNDFCEPQGDPLVSLLEGQAAQRPQSVDCLFSKQLTQHLFSSNVNSEGLDLFSINIQRGRDHGLPPYTRWREACGLPPVRDYYDLKGEIPDHILDRIKAIYGTGGVHEVDLYVGGVSEIPVNGGILGRTFTCIVANQFSALKFGDRFWYENLNHSGAFTPEQIVQIQRTTLSGLLCRNAVIKELQVHAFIAESVINRKIPCDRIREFTSLDTQHW